MRKEPPFSSAQVQPKVLEGIQEQLKQIRVYGVQNVITYLSYQGERIPGSEVKTPPLV